MQTKKKRSFKYRHGIFQNEIHMQKDLKYNVWGYSIVKITQLGLRPKKILQLCFETKNTIIPDSLKHLPIIHSNKKRLW
jgi:hypothetical protein